MTVQDIISAAEYSEIAGTSIFTKPIEVKHPAMIAWINQALVEISKKIPLESKEQIINLVADSLDTGLTYAIADDCLQIVAVYGENGKELPINDETDPYSVFTPSFNRILVPKAEEGSAISIIYTARPIPLTSINDTLPVNEVFLDSILMFLAHKAYMPTENPGNKASISSNYYARFVASIAHILESGMYMPDGIKEHSHFDRGGWI